MVETIECPYCHRSHAVKVLFSDGHQWRGSVTTDPNNNYCMCNVYFCPGCGSMSLLDAPKEKSNGEKVDE